MSNTNNSIHESNPGGFRREPVKVLIAYPLASPLCALTLMLVYVLSHEPELLHSYNIPVFLFSAPMHFVYATITVIIIAADLQRFLQQKKYSQEAVKNLENELERTWQSKKKLQEKTHIYSGHADKLKRFISDKLLEYIEYDEKFLHFKNIASEVRHNGVISYDIVRTALEKANSMEPGFHPEQAQVADIESFADTHRFGLPSNPDNDYRQALDAMKYLWDLLDLSTADNIALHIGNILIECEEQFYHQELNKNSEKQIGDGINPCFNPAFASIKSLAPFLEPLLMEKMIADIKVQSKAQYFHQDDEIESNFDSSESATTKGKLYQSSTFRISLAPTENLLGNQNHLILLVENLIKNAQFFSGKTPFKQHSDRIAFTLKQHRSHIALSVYNRGPHVDQTSREQLFQLGYSTRRAKEHHGKGLGLFFVNQIITGYQGKISINNIVNQAQTYSIRFQFDNQSVVNKVIETQVDEPRPKAIETGDAQGSDSLLWQFDSPIESIEISSANNDQTHLFTDIEQRNPSEIIDPQFPLTPFWCLQIKPKGTNIQVIFKPLDINGVEFSIKLPSAESRLNGEEALLEEDLEEDVERLNKQFRELGEL